ncbi:protein of ctr copper transporter family [Pseudohyphozyma bogoriensis]|nr:protein of ctr copper transporter family [Pseudohyphozyma bogoriensis]
MESSMNSSMGSMTGTETSNSTTTMASTMMSAFTTELGMSNLWFVNWTPTTAGSTFGACVGLFFLAILSRLLAALRSSAEIGWANALSLYCTEERLFVPTLTKSDDKALPKPTHKPRHRSPPFISAIDVPRGILFAFQSFVGYLLMLAIMSYNAWFFVAILVGLGIGETAFGRYSCHLHEGQGEGTIHLLTSPLHDSEGSIHL